LTIWDRRLLPRYESGRLGRGVAGMSQRTPGDGFLFANKQRLGGGRNREHSRHIAVLGATRKEIRIVDIQHFPETEPLRVDDGSLDGVAADGTGGGHNRAGPLQADYSQLLRRTLLVLMN